MCEECVEAKGCRKNMRVIFVEKSDLIGRVGYVRYRAASVQRLLRDDGFVAVRSGIRVAPFLRDGGEWRVSAFVWLQNETHGMVHNRNRS